MNLLASPELFSGSDIFFWIEKVAKWWFQIFFIFMGKWSNLTTVIFLRWVQTTNQVGVFSGFFKRSSGDWFINIVDFPTLLARRVCGNVYLGVFNHFYWVTPFIHPHILPHHFICGCLNSSQWEKTPFTSDRPSTCNCIMMFKILAVCIFVTFFFANRKYLQGYKIYMIRMLYLLYMGATTKTSGYIVQPFHPKSHGGDQVYHRDLKPSSLLLTTKLPDAVIKAARSAKMLEKMGKFSIFPEKS